MTIGTSFRLDYPPSVNRYWRHSRGMVYLTAEGRAYRGAAAGLTEATFDGPVGLSIEVVYPDRRRRDIDNLLKAVLDAIGHAGIYDDDSQVKELRVKVIGIEDPGCVDVCLAPLEDFNV